VASGESSPCPAVPPATAKGGGIGVGLRVPAAPRKYTESMAASSSVSTYLDVTQAAKAAPASRTDSEFNGRAAKVLAAIHAGTDLVTELPEHTGLPTNDVLTILGWLSDSGLVELDNANDVLRVQLTDAARTALSAT
jgi:hypothetical protein